MDIPLVTIFYVMENYNLVNFPPIDSYSGHSISTDTANNTGYISDYNFAF